MKKHKGKGALRLPLKITRVAWRELAQTLGPVLIVIVAMILVLHFVSPAPPRTLTISSGPKGSTFEANAERYQKVLARSGIKLKIIESEGSLDNLNRLSNPKSGVDIALVQSGLSGSADMNDVTSLGSVFYEPLFIFYRSSKPLSRLSELTSQRIAIGPEARISRSVRPSTSSIAMYATSPFPIS